MRGHHSNCTAALGSAGFAALRTCNMWLTLSTQADSKECGLEEKVATHEGYARVMWFKASLPGC